MLSKNHTLKASSLIILLFTLPKTTLAKSVYVITDTADPNLAAYEIQGTSLGCQTNYVCEPDWGAVGLAIDPDSHNSKAFSLSEIRFPADFSPFLRKNQNFLVNIRRLRDGFIMRMGLPRSTYKAG